MKHSEWKVENYTVVESIYIGNLDCMNSSIGTDLRHLSDSESESFNNDKTLISEEVLNWDCEDQSYNQLSTTLSALKRRNHKKRTASHRFAILHGNAKEIIRAIQDDSSASNCFSTLLDAYSSALSNTEPSQFTDITARHFSMRSAQELKSITNSISKLLQYMREEDSEEESESSSSFRVQRPLASENIQLISPGILHRSERDNENESARLRNPPNTNARGNASEVQTRSSKKNRRLTTPHIVQSTSNASRAVASALSATALNASLRVQYFQESCQYQNKHGEFYRCPFLNCKKKGLKGVLGVTRHIQHSNQHRRELQSFSGGFNWIGVVQYAGIHPGRIIEPENG